MAVIAHVHGRVPRGTDASSFIHGIIDAGPDADPDVGRTHWIRAFTASECPGSGVS